MCDNFSLLLMRRELDMNYEMKCIVIAKTYARKNICMFVKKDPNNPNNISIGVCLAYQFATFAYSHIRISAYPHTHISAYSRIRIPAYPRTPISAFSTKPSISKSNDVKLNLEHNNVNSVQRSRLQVMAHVIFFVIHRGITRFII